MNDRTPASDGFVDNYLLYLLARASDQASRQFHAYVKSQGLGVAEWRVLASLSDGPKTVGELAARTLYQQPSLTKVVDRMTADGLVARQRDTRDGRVVWVRATAAGQRIVDDLRPMAEAHEDQVLTRYSAAERAQLKRLLKQLIARTEEDAAP